MLAEDEIIEIDAADFGDDSSDEFETNGEGLLRKINTVLVARKKGQYRQNNPAKKEPDNLTEQPKTFRVTIKERRVLKRLARQSGYSENEVAYYFFAVGMKKEFEKERDKFDLSIKVKRAYSEVLNTELGKLREAVKEELTASARLTQEQFEKTNEYIYGLRHESSTSFQFIFWSLKKIVGMVGMLKFAVGKTWITLDPDANEFKKEGIKGYHKYAVVVEGTEETDYTTEAIKYISENKISNETTEKVIDTKEKAV